VAFVVVNAGCGNGIAVKACRCPVLVDAPSSPFDACITVAPTVAVGAGFETCTAFGSRQLLRVPGCAWNSASLRGA